MKLNQSLFILILISLSVFGCSSASDSPVSSSSSPDIPDGIDSQPLMVSDTFADNSPAAGMGVMGLYELNIDPANEKAELTSLRQGALTDVLEVVDITNFMTLLPCVDCVHMKGFGFDTNGNIVLSIGIKHPFGVGNPAEPITGKNRADLHIFNVEGIVVSNLVGYYFDSIDELTAGFNLVNADGYTGYLDSSLDSFYLTLATIHPYITHFDTYSQGNFDAANPMGFASVTTPPPSGNLVMPMGSGYDYEDYIFDIPGGQMSFIFAVGCTYAVTTNTFEDRFAPEFRVPQHNKKASSEVSIEITSNNLIGLLTTSTAQFDLTVIDINHGTAVGTNLNQMLADSSVDQIKIDIPDVLATPLVINGNSSVSGDGHTPATPLLYQGTITNTNAADTGTYYGLIEVHDSYAPGQNTHPYIGNKDGGNRVPPGTGPLAGLFVIDKFATYQVFTIDVAPSVTTPNAILLADPTPTRINWGDVVDFDGTTSSDPNGTIVSYEFDFDWSGLPASFSADVTNTTGITSYSAWSDPNIDYTVGLRVTDDESDTGYDFVVVDINKPATPDLKKVPDILSINQFETLTLDATGSVDDDGTIELYEFDFDWDLNPANFNADVSNIEGVIYDHRFLVANPNLYVGLRCTDNDGYRTDDNIAYIEIEVVSFGSNVIWVNAENVDGPWTGSYNAPFKYIQDAVDVANNDDTIWILPGRYNEDESGLPSSGDAEITISGISGLTLFGDGRPVVNLHSYFGTDTIHGLSANSCPNLTIEGLSFQAEPNGYASAFALTNCADSTVSDCTILPALPMFTNFVQFNSSPRCIAKSNFLTDVSLDFRGTQPANLFTINSSDDVQITENFVSNLTFNVPATTSGNHSYLISGSNSQRLEISKNNFSNCLLLINDDSTFTFSAIRLAASCDDAIVRNNLFSNLILNNTTFGESTVSLLDFESCANVDIYNNTIDSINLIDDAATVVVMNFDQMTGVNAYNNIATQITSADDIVGYQRTLGDAITVDYSDLWSLNGTSVVRFDNVTEGGNCLDVNPMYTAPPFDYHLEPGSPCAGSGSGGEDMGCYGGSDPLP